jgi:hypothetical protein
MKVRSVFLACLTFLGLSFRNLMFFKNFMPFRNLIKFKGSFKSWLFRQESKQVAQKSLCLVLGLFWGLMLSAVLFVAPGTTPAWAGLNDDRYEGNIFPLYAGNGSLVPPRITLAEARQRQLPALLVFYIDDSADCKKYSSVVSQLDSFYGRAAGFIPISVDAIPPQSQYEPTEPGYYYGGFVPQTVLLDGEGKVVLNQKGAIAFETVDDAFRQVFNLLPRSESVELKRRQVNEVNTELVQ